MSRAVIKTARGDCFPPEGSLAEGSLVGDNSVLGTAHERADASDILPGLEVVWPAVAVPAYHQEH